MPTNENNDRYDVPVEYNGGPYDTFINQNFDDLAEDVPDSGTIANRPDAGQDFAPQFYYATDERNLYHNSGSQWTTIHPTPTSTTLYMSDYTTPDDGTTDDSAFETAISDATPGDTLVFDRGNYRLSSSHTINKTLHIKGVDSTIQYTNTSNNNPAILFKGGGLGGSASLDSAASKGDRTLSLGSVSPYAAGDYVLVLDGSYSETVNAPIQFQQIESVDSANLNITLAGGLRQGFPASSTNVYQVNLLESPTMDGLETFGGGLRHLQFRWCHNPEYRDCRVTEYTEVSLYALDCWKPRYRDCEAYDPNGLASGEGEPIALYRCSDGYIESPRIEDCRRGIDFAWGSHNITIIDPVIRGVSLNGISVHQNDQSGVISVTGGEVVCDPNGQSGAGITSSTTAQLYIDGMRIVARENGVICSGETHISNTTVETTESVSAPQLAAFNIKHGNTTIRDCFIDDREGLYDFPVWIDGAGTAMEHIAVDVETAHPDGNHIYLDARDGPLSDIKVSGMLRNMGGTTDQAIFVRADTTNIIENVDISVTATDLPNQGVRVLSGGTEQITDLTFHDCYFTTGLAAIYTDGPGTFGSIRVTDCNCDTGSISLSFNETVNKLFVTNNDVNGSIDSSGATNKTVTGNL